VSTFVIARQIVFFSLDKFPDPHPALRATFSRWEKENQKRHLHPGVRREIKGALALAPLPSGEGLG
jgi:hypothetical protein